MNNDSLKTGFELGETNPKLVSFLYLLLRDQLPSGKIEKIMEDISNVGPNKPVFTNEILASYAKNLADRLEE